MSNRRRLPDRRPCMTFELECNGQKYLATVAPFRDGALGVTLDILASERTA
jgi:hypothetical protein